MIPMNKEAKQFSPPTARWISAPVREKMKKKVVQTLRFDPWPACHPEPLHVIDFSSGGLLSPTNPQPPTAFLALRNTTVESSPIT